MYGIVRYDTCASHGIPSLLEDRFWRKEGGEYTYLALGPLVCGKVINLLLAAGDYLVVVFSKGNGRGDYGFPRAEGETCKKWHGRIPPAAYSGLTGVGIIGCSQN